MVVEAVLVEVVVEEARHPYCSGNCNCMVDQVGTARKRYFQRILGVVD